MKICSKCGVEKDLNQFYKNRDKDKNNLCSKCKTCFKEYYQKHAEQKKAYSKEYYQKHTEQIKARHKRYRQKRAKHIKIYMKKYRQNNTDQIKAYNKNYLQNNKDKFNAHTRKYQAALIQRYPKWLTPEQEQQIIDFYIDCPPGMVVDHIYPLQGRYVSGLHHPDNLQYLTRLENISKHNNCPEVDALWKESNDDDTKDD